MYTRGAKRGMRLDMWLVPTRTRGSERVSVRGIAAAREQESTVQQDTGKIQQHGCCRGSASHASRAGAGSTSHRDRQRQALCTDACRATSTTHGSQQSRRHSSDPPHSTGQKANIPRPPLTRPAASRRRRALSTPCAPSGEKEGWRADEG